MMIFKKEPLLPAILLESLTHLQKEAWTTKQTSQKSTLAYSPSHYSQWNLESLQLGIPYIPKISTPLKINMEPQK